MDGRERAPSDPWSVVRDAGAEPAERVRALHALARAPAPELARFVTESLPDAEGTWRRALIAAAERCVEVPDDVRAHLADQLFSAAETLAVSANAFDQRAVWAALRRASALVPADAPCRLLPFLAAGQRPKTKQAALQSLFNVEEIPVAREVPFQPELLERVYTLADSLLDPEIFADPIYGALAMCAFDAAVALRHPLVSQLTSRLIALERPSALREARRSLERLATHWTDESRGEWLAEVRTALAHPETS